MRAFIGSVSGRNSVTKAKFAIANKLAAQTGSVTLYFARVVPNPGPKINPRPKATPIRPNVFARFCGVEISANTAVAVAAVPPLAPSMILATNSSSRGRLVNQLGMMLAQSMLTVKANIKSPITEPDTHVMMIGFRP